jgi:hypothetical protein
MSDGSPPHPAPRLPYGSFVRASPRRSHSHPRRSTGCRAQGHIDQTIPIPIPIVIPFPRRGTHREPPFPSRSSSRRPDRLVHRGRSGSTGRVGKDERHGSFAIVRIIALIAILVVFVFVIVVRIVVACIFVGFVIIVVVIIVVFVLVFVFSDGYMGTVIVIVGMFVSRGGRGKAERGGT